MDGNNDACDMMSHDRTLGIHPFRVSTSVSGAVPCKHLARVGNFPFIPGFTTPVDLHFET